MALVAAASARESEVARTVGETGGKNSYYDQIAWFGKGKRAPLTLR
jgi:hypothetical protein